MDKREQTKWIPPRGIRLLEVPNRPARPYAVQWRIEGRRKTKTFPTREAQLGFAKSLAADAKLSGTAAFRLDPDEARAWRAFRADIGNADLDAVAACWRRHGDVAGTVELAAAVESFLAAKKAEDVSKGTLGHLRPILHAFRDAMGHVNAGSIQRDQLEKYLEGIEGAVETRRGVHRRIKTFFRWLRDTRQIRENPCDGWKGPKQVKSPISVMPVADGVKLFSVVPGGRHGRETLGRLALEAFVGMRHETASLIGADAFNFKGRVITISAAIDKNRQEQYIEHAPETVWKWLEWSDPSKWTMGKFTYRNAKSALFTHLGIPHPHNVLRHSAASYRIAIDGDAGKTAAMLTHANLRMLWKNYRGKAGGEENGKAWFAILP